MTTYHLAVSTASTLHGCFSRAVSSFSSTIDFATRKNGTAWSFLLSSLAHAFSSNSSSSYHPWSLGSVKHLLTSKIVTSIPRWLIMGGNQHSTDCKHPLKCHLQGNNHKTAIQIRSSLATFLPFSTATCSHWLSLRSRVWPKSATRSLQKTGRLEFQSSQLYFSHTSAFTSYCWQAMHLLI